MTNADPSQLTPHVSATYWPVCPGVISPIFTVPRYIAVGPFVDAAATAPAAIIVAARSAEPISPRRTHPRFAPLGMSVNASVLRPSLASVGRWFVDPAETLSDAQDPA